MSWNIMQINGKNELIILQQASGTSEKKKCRQDNQTCSDHSPRRSNASLAGWSLFTQVHLDDGQDSGVMFTAVVHTGDAHTRRAQRDLSLERGRLVSWTQSTRELGSSRTNVYWWLPWWEGERHIRKWYTTGEPGNILLLELGCYVTLLKLIHSLVASLSGSNFIWSFWLWL